MPDPNPGLPPCYLRTPEAARFVGSSGLTLEKHRTYGTGPSYSKIGSRVIYAVTDLQSSVNHGTKAATSDDTGETVLPAKRHVAVSLAYAAPLLLGRLFVDGHALGAKLADRGGGRHLGRGHGIGLGLAQPGLEHCPGRWRELIPKARVDIDLG